MKKILAAFMIMCTVSITETSKAQSLSDREAAAIAIGTAAILTGILITTHKNRNRQYHHHYYYERRYSRHPYSLNHRYTEQRHYAPPQYYYRPYHR